MNLTTNQLEFDRLHIWHPYEVAEPADSAIPIARAEGVHLIQPNGRELIDGMSSWWCAIHGYNQPTLNEAIHRQTQKMAHIMFGGFAHQPAIDLARTLLSIAPEGLRHIFFCDSGSIAVEVALKMALQYMQATGQPQRSRFMTIRHGYHGDSFGAMSVCDPDQGMHHLFTRFLPVQVFADAPNCGFHEPWRPESFDPFRALFARHQPELAAVILEPIVQGAGGMRFYHPKYLEEVRTLCSEHGVLLILDEIATGFGRTGTLFACEHAGIAPDIMCIGKALTGGYLSLAATLASETVANGICSGGRPLMHGPTFMANPLACAVAKASVDLLLNSNWKAKVKLIEKRLARGLAPARKLENVKDVRVLGAIGVMEMLEEAPLRAVQEYAIHKGVWLRPFGRLIYTMPPYICDEEQIDTIAGVMVELAQYLLNRQPDHE
ncbi:MAG: adenosylmethionine--8-amino-7-oxononanoate transaminase [Verrucomicrobiota bacterium]|nr:adenosylmethionine--8-amino-7-oxononanoate transaminase [Verrucomicrobiota bacterium]